MKRISFTRKSILQAIHAACVALFLAAASVAHAQTATGDGSGNVTITGSGSATFDLGPGSSPQLAAGGTLTIAAGANASQPSLSTASAYEIQIDTVATTINNGYVGNANGENSAVALEYTSVSTAGNVTLQNNSTGTITASGYIGNIISVSIQNVTEGSISITNNGHISESGDSALGPAIVSTVSGIYALDTYASGAITLANTGTISAEYSGAEGADAANLATSGSGGITVTNSGTMSADAGLGGGSVFGLAVNSSGSGNISVTNSGSISGSGYASGGVAGIIAVASGTGSIAITNSGTLSGANTASGYMAYGIEVANPGTGSVTVDNTNTVDATTSVGMAFGIEVTANGAVNLQSSGTISVTSSNTAVGMFVLGQAADTSLTNHGTITVSGAYGASTSGMYDLNSTGSILITNTGSVTVTTGGNQFGALYGKTGGTGNVTITNSGIVNTSTSSGYVRGLSTDTSTGTGESIINNLRGGVVTATSTDSSHYAIGIFVDASAGAVVVNNAGSSTGTDTGGLGYGIGVDGNSSTINNSGQAIGTTFGISTEGVSIVNNSGLASGGFDSIFVGTGSTVNLLGNSSVVGTVRGGADDTSNSVLNFNLVVRSNFAATKASLDAAIASYDQAYAAANGDGSDVISSVVVINSTDYQWEDFGSVVDNLIQGRLYRDTPGFYNEGLVLDNLPSGNAVATRLLNALGNVPESGLVNALSELSPKELQVYRNVAFDNNTFTDEQINNHLANRRDGLTGFDSSALTVQDSSLDPTLNQVKDHLLAYDPAATPGLVNDSMESLLGLEDPKDMKNAQVNTKPVERWSSFIAGDVILADLSHNANLEDANYTTGNVTAGVDYQLDNHFTIGALLAYAHTDASLDSRGSSATVDSYSPGIYASYVDKGWYGNFLGVYTRNAYTEDRNIDITGLNGDNHGGTSGNQGSANLTGGYEFQKGAFKFGPVASVQYVHLAIDSIQEQGPTALSIDSQNQDSLRSLIGWEGRFDAKVGPLILSPHLSVSWQHEYLDRSRGINAQFTGAGGGSFSTQTDSPDRDSAFIDAGLDATVSKNVTVFLDYETQAGQNDFFGQSAQGGVKIGF